MVFRFYFQAIGLELFPQLVWQNISRRWDHLSLQNLYHTNRKGHLPDLFLIPSKGYNPRNEEKLQDVLYGIILLF
jgi:hypothetical protein